MRPARKNGAPEHSLQMSVKEYLTYALPDGLFWTATSHGVRLSMNAAVKMKAAGLKRGLPDLLFVLPGGQTKYIELKTKDGSLTFEQKAFRDVCTVENWALCRSVDQVAAALAEWGVKLKAVPAGVLLRSAQQQEAA